MQWHVIRDITPKYFGVPFYYKIRNLCQIVFSVKKNVISELTGILQLLLTDGFEIPQNAFSTTTECLRKLQKQTTNYRLPVSHPAGLLVTLGSEFK
jgi:hypothetical protein